MKRNDKRGSILNLLMAVVLVGGLLLGAVGKLLVRTPAAGGESGQAAVTATVPPSTAAAINATPETTNPAEENIAAVRARLDLAQQLGLKESAVTIAGVQPADWPDTCLGVAAAAGTSCQQQTVHGYQVTLQAQGQTYDVHTNTYGSEVQIVPTQSPSP